MPNLRATVVVNLARDTPITSVNATVSLLLVKPFSMFFLVPKVFVSSQAAERPSLAYYV